MRISYSSRYVSVSKHDELLDGLMLDDDDDIFLKDVVILFAVEAERIVSRAYKMEEYANMLGAYTRQSAGTDTESSARYLAQSYT